MFTHEEKEELEEEEGLETAGKAGSADRDVEGFSVAAGNAGDARAGVRARDAEEELETADSDVAGSSAAAGNAGDARAGVLAREEE